MSSPAKNGNKKDQRQNHGHSHAHGHSHGHSHGPNALKNIRFAFLLNFGFSIVELVGGLWIGSLAIVADSIHDFGDSMSLGVAWFLERYANKGKDSKFNFGYRRFSLLSALISGVVIATGSGIILIESVQRVFSAEAKPPAAVPMVLLAVVGLAMNGWAAWRLSRGQTQNERMLTWHLIEDVLGWAAVLIGGLIIYFTGVTWLDPLLAAGLAIFVAFNVIRNLKSTVYLFLQGRPENFDEDVFLKETLAIEGVGNVDHLAVWSLDGESSVLSARLHLHAVRDPDEIEKVKTRVRELAARQGAHATLETCLAATAPHTDE